jgi:serine/threonine-protein kinase RsbW
MLALNVLRWYSKLHVLIVRCTYSKYAQRKQRVIRRYQRGLMLTPAPRALVLRTNGVTYPGNAEHISAVRADLRVLLSDCPLADDVILCASELAANAAVHSNSRLAGGSFTVRAKIEPGHCAWIEVEDNGGPWIPATSDPSRYHGLDITRVLAADWGIEGDHTTRTIWARFDWPDHS